MNGYESPVVGALQSLGGSIRNVGQDISESLRRSAKVEMELADLERELKDPTRLAQKAQSQAYLDQLDTAKKTPYSVIPFLKKNASNAEFFAAADIFPKVADTISSISGNTVSFQSDPDKEGYGMFIGKDGKPISEFDMFSKYGNIISDVANANWDASEGLTQAIHQTKVLLDEELSKGTNADPSKIKQYRASLINMQNQATDVKSLLELNNKRLSFVKQLDARMKTINPNYRGLDTTLAQIIAKGEKYDNILYPKPTSREVKPASAEDLRKLREDGFSMYMYDLNFTYDDTLKTWIDPTTKKVVDKDKLSRLTNDFNTGFNKVVSYNPDATSDELYHDIVSAFRLVSVTEQPITNAPTEKPGVLDVIKDAIEPIREKNIQEREKKKAGTLVTGKIIRSASDRNAIDRIKSLAERTTSEEGRRKVAKELGFAEEYDERLSRKKFIDKYVPKVKEYNKQNLSKQEAYDKILNEIRSDKSFNKYEYRINELFKYYWANNPRSIK